MRRVHSIATRMATAFTFSAGLLLGILGAAAADLPAGMGLAGQWSHFLGPNYDGTNGLAAFRPTGLSVIWSRDVGPGCSSVTLAEGRLLTLGNREDRDVVICLDPATGTVKWTFEYPSERLPKLYEGGPNSTPTLAGGRVYTLGRQGQIHCLDAATGTKIWAASCAQWAPKGGWWGFSDSPVVWGDKVFINASDKGMALKRDTGDIVWSGSQAVAAYGTLLPLPGGNPVVDRPALVVQTCAGVDVIDPDTGTSLLNEPPAWTRYASNCNGVAPRLHGRSLLLMHGSKGLSRVSLADGKWTEDWLCGDLVYDKGNWFTFNLQVVHGTFLYAIAGNAKEENTRLVCVDLESGQIVWSRPESFGNLLLAADTLILVAQDGTIAWGVLEGNGYRETFREKRLNGGKGPDKDGPYWGHPVLHDGHLYVRSNLGKLTCFRVEQQP